MNLQQQWRLAARLVTDNHKLLVTHYSPKPKRRSRRRDDLNEISDRMIRFPVRFKSRELVAVKAKAESAGCPTATYIRASALGSDYKQPLHSSLLKALLNLTREITAQGRNLHVIADYCKKELPSAQEELAILASLKEPMIEALRALRRSLTEGAPQP